MRDAKSFVQSTAIVCSGSINYRDADVDRPVLLAFPSVNHCGREHTVDSLPIRRRSTSCICIIVVERTAL